MQKIEKEMIAALKNNENFCKSNIKVSNGSVSLCGIHIATISLDGIMITNCGGWRRTPLKDMLNVILDEFADGCVCINQADFKWHYNINGELVPFTSRTFALKK